MRVSAVAKFLVAAVLAVIVAIQAAISDDLITHTEVVQVVLAGLTALGVYVVPNNDQPPA